MSQIFPIPSPAQGDQGFTAEEAISGVRAVTISPSGNLRIAMAAVSGRMPAIGIVTENFLSGATLGYNRMQNRYQFTSGLADFSGYLGLPLFVGRSGSIVQISGSFGSGGFASGDLGQRVGFAIGSAAMVFNVHPIAFSGAGGASIGGGPQF